MPPLVVIVDDMSGPARRMEFERSPVRIGRAPDNDLQLDMAFVSSRHAEIRFDGHDASYVDLGSTNGTFLEGQRMTALQPMRVLGGALRVHIGSVQLTIEHGQITREKPLSRSGAAHSAPPSTPPTSAMAAPSSEPVFSSASDLSSDRSSTAVDPDLPPRALASSAIPAYTPTPPPPAEAEVSASGDRPADSSFSPPSILAPRVAPRPSRHPTPGPPTILPGSFDARHEPAAHGRNAISPPTIFPTSPKDFPMPLASRFPEPEMPGPVAGEIHVSTPARHPAAPIAPIPPERTAPASDPHARPSRHAPSPASGVAAAPRGDEADFADLRELTTSLCDDLMKLRAAMEAFGRETGIRTFSLSERARLHEMRDGAELLRSLIAPSTRAIRRTEVRALFSDLVAHQLAMMGAIVEGARATVTRMDPEAFEKDNPRRRLPFLDSGRWDEYLQRFHEFQQDDQAIQEAVFGAEFADAYAAARGK